MAKINIRENLSKRDLISDNKYDLRNTYDSLNLSESKKKQLAKALYENKSNRAIYSILNNNKLNEDMVIDEFSRYSEEYEKLDRASTFLTAMSPNKFYYYVGDTYFDFGQDWKWTTILAKTPRGDSYQALNPRQQEDILLATSDEELEEIAKQILKNSYVDKGFMQEGFSTKDYKLGDIVTWHNDRYVIIDDENEGDLLVLRPLNKFQDSDFDDINSGDSSEDVFLSKYQLAKPFNASSRNSDQKIHESKYIREDIDDNDFDEDVVEEGNIFFADGKDYIWEERIAGPIHLDFDNWAVWSARESVSIFDYATEKPDGGYDIDKDAYIKAYIESPIKYFVVDEDTGFIDWGPCDTDIEAKDFLNSKVEDWENDM